MSHRYEVVFVETFRRRLNVTVDLPDVQPRTAHVYGVARRAALELVREREKDEHYTPDLQSIGLHYLGEVKDEDTTIERESGGEVQPSGSTSTSVNGDATGAEEGNQQ